LILNRVRSYAKLVGPQSYVRRHESSLAHMASFGIIAEGLNSWVQLRHKETQEEEWQGWQRPSSFCCIVVLLVYFDVLCTTIVVLIFF